MIVTCPECATRYAVDDAAFKSGGRAVRCAHCACEWYQIGSDTPNDRPADPSAFPMNIEPERPSVSGRRSASEHLRAARRTLASGAGSDIAAAVSAISETGPDRAGDSDDGFFAGEAELERARAALGVGRGAPARTDRGAPASDAGDRDRIAAPEPWKPNGGRANTGSADNGRGVIAAADVAASVALAHPADLDDRDQHDDPFVDVGFDAPESPAPASAFSGAARRDGPNGRHDAVAWPRRDGAPRGSDAAARAVDPAGRNGFDARHRGVPVGAFDEDDREHDDLDHDDLDHDDLENDDLDQIDGDRGGSDGLESGDGRWVDGFDSYDRAFTPAVAAAARRETARAGGVSYRTTAFGRADGALRRPTRSRRRPTPAADERTDAVADRHGGFDAPARDGVLRRPSSARGEEALFDPAPAAAASQADSFDHSYEARPRKASRGRGLARFVLALGVVAGGLFAAYALGPRFAEIAPIAAPTVDAYRDRVNAVFSNPQRAPTAQAGQASGLVFVDYQYDLVERAEGPALEVWGRVANNGAEAVLTPTIEIVSRNAEGEALQRWLAHPEVDKLSVGQTARFTSRMMYPLGPVTDVDLYIATR